MSQTVTIHNVFENPSEIVYQIHDALNGKVMVRVESEQPVEPAYDGCHNWNVILQHDGEESVYTARLHYSLFDESEGVYTLRADIAESFANHWLLRLVANAEYYSEPFEEFAKKSPGYATCSYMRSHWNTYNKAWNDLVGHVGQDTVSKLVSAYSELERQLGSDSF